MIKIITNHLISLAIATSLAITVPSGVRAENHTVEPIGSGISYKMEFRAEGSAWNKNIREGRVILDEMAANKGTDDILNDFNWQNLEQKSDYAAHWIKEQDGVKFNEVLSDIEESSQTLEDRANQIQALRDKISKELASETARWDKLMAEDDKIVAYLEDALETKLAGFFLSKILQAIGKKIGASLVVVGGKALGPISTLLALVDFFEAYDEYAEMKLMLDRMLERVEIVAYLDVLIKKYDGLISAHDQIIDELIKTYSIYSKSECR